jgi:hypothetical protein
MDEGRKRVLLIAASILAARKLAMYEGGTRVPAKDAREWLLKRWQISVDPNFSIVPNLLARQQGRVLRIVPIQKRHVPLKLDEFTYLL